MDWFICDQKFVYSHDKPSFGQRSHPQGTSRELGIECRQFTSMRITRALQPISNVSRKSNISCIHKLVYRNLGSSVSNQNSRHSDRIMLYKHVFHNAPFNGHIDLDVICIRRLHVFFIEAQTSKRTTPVRKPMKNGFRYIRRNGRGHVRKPCPARVSRIALIYDERS